MLRIAVMGTGLIGASIGLALRRAGHQVVGTDVDDRRATRALEIGALDRIASGVLDAAAGVDAVVVAVPVSRIAELVVEAVDAGAPVVTDVGSVKAPVVRDVVAARPRLAPRFVGGHPMAGSEQDGLDGADADLFVGATWVLTPTPTTDPAAHTVVRGVVTELGAEIVEIPPVEHDLLVATVSHVPQLAATTLMDVATRGRDDRPLVQRLAAGGFRDMTRIAASHPAIWLDICEANRDAILAGLDGYLGALAEVRTLVADGDAAALLELLERARDARRNLPVGVALGGELEELRIPVPDRRGVLAEVTTMASRLGVNIADIEIAHSMEATGGVLVLVVSSAGADALEPALNGAGYHPTRAPLP